MGCTSTKEPVKKLSVKKTPANFGRRTDLNPKDFMFVKQTNDVCVRTPGSIEGQQFVIEDNENCDIYLLDHIASMNVDSCKNCRIVTGPVSSSVFLRDCSNCVVVLACQQLRLRNCHNMKILLFSTTGPIIESSTCIDFGCYSYQYFEMDRHFVAAELNMWNNQWNEVFDFTPGGSGGALSSAPSNHNIVVDSTKPNKIKYQYKLLPPDADHRLLLGVEKSTEGEGAGVVGGGCSCPRTSTATSARLRDALGTDFDFDVDAVATDNGNIGTDTDTTVSPPALPGAISSPSIRAGVRFRTGVLPSCGMEECYRFASVRREPLEGGRQPVCFHAFVIAPLALSETLRRRIMRWLEQRVNVIVRSRVKEFLKEQWSQLEMLLSKHLSDFKDISTSQKKKLSNVLLHEPVIILHLMTSDVAQLAALGALLVEKSSDSGITSESEFHQYVNYVSVLHQGELTVMPAGATETRNDIVSELAHHVFYIWKDKDSH